MFSFTLNSEYLPE